MSSIDSARYDIDVNLKYSDDTLDQAYTARNADLTEGEPLRVRADSRPGDSPFQVNVRVGGLQAEGNTYTVSVVPVVSVCKWVGHHLKVLN